MEKIEVYLFFFSVNLTMRLHAYYFILIMSASPAPDVTNLFFFQKYVIKVARYSNAHK